MKLLSLKLLLKSLLRRDVAMLASLFYRLKGKLKSFLGRYVAAPNQASSLDQSIQISKPEQYQYDFAMLTCSFRRDMKRCFNAYQSFEQYSQDSVPYFLCVPEQDLKDFTVYFSQFLAKNEIKALPNFLTERQLMEMAGEPVERALPGYYLQDALRLKFWFDRDCQALFQ